MVVDELLFFIQNKLSMKPLTLDVLIQICASFYNEEEIFSIKKLLFDTIKPDRFRFIKHIGQGKKQDDLMDVCKLLLSTETAHLPMFVARDLWRIPCATDTYDVTKVHKELEVMRKSICDLTENQTALMDVLSSHLKNSNQAQSLTDIPALNSPRQSHSPPEVISPSQHVRTLPRCISTQAPSASSTGSQAQQSHNSAVYESRVSASPVGKEDTQHETTETDGSSSAGSSKPEFSVQGALETNIKPRLSPLTYEAERMPDVSHTILSDHSSFTTLKTSKLLMRPI